jgi:hypothetical protein
VVEGAENRGNSQSARCPLTNDEVQQMILRNDPKEMRAHGWAILNAQLSDEMNDHNANSAFEAAWDSNSDPWENKCTLGLGGDSALCPPIKPVSSIQCQLPKPQSAADYLTKIEIPVQQTHLTDQSHNQDPQLPLHLLR